MALVGLLLLFLQLFVRFFQLFGASSHMHEREALQVGIAQECHLPADGLEQLGDLLGILLSNGLYITLCAVRNIPYTQQPNLEDEKVSGLHQYIKAGQLGVVRLPGHHLPAP